MQLNDLIQALPNQQQKTRFQRVVDFYPKLQPRHFQLVENLIDYSRFAASTKDRMHEFNQQIYDFFFDHMGFIKESHGFAIGDPIYIYPRDKGLATIVEFEEHDGNVYVIPSNHNQINTKFMIELLSKKPLNEANFTTYFQKDQQSIYDNLNIQDITSDVDAFLNYYADIIDFNPVYQRNLIWTLNQKQTFIKKMLQKQITIKPTYIGIPYQQQDNYGFEILDGKQRLTTILSYVRNQFDVDGHYFKDLPPIDRMTFLNTPVIYKLIQYYSSNGWNVMPIDQKIELFLQINEYGQHVSTDHLDKVKQEFLPKGQTDDSNS